ncbi:DUF6090 family protein [Paraglaciecola sp.]|uniref:DUF6090 family protein n=1 Tax=Paraglaciecola sp. TaxID=1920173 RepID=UPI003EFA63F6
MLIILRKIKRTFFSNQQFQNYLLYALGEIVLVVIGILIALQINSWNSNQEQQKALSSYLKIVAKNMRDDGVLLNNTRRRREDAFEQSGKAEWFAFDKTSFSVSEITQFNRAFSEIKRLHYFNADLSGYEALKSSGNLKQMQGKAIENLLYLYYETARRIGLKERNHNEYVRQLDLQLVTTWPKNLSLFEIAEPDLLTTERFKALQPEYQQLIADSSMKALFTQARSVQPLIQDYERLKYLGRAFIRMVEKGMMEYDDTTLSELDAIYDMGQGDVEPNLIVDGRVGLHAYVPNVGDSNYTHIKGASKDLPLNTGLLPAIELTSAGRVDKALHVSYSGNITWAGFWIFSYDDSGILMPLDFSEFDTLQLELKGDVGGETLLIHIEDSEDERDGSATKVEIQLTNEWQTYEIKLSDFKTADLSKLTNVLGFVFKQPQPLSFSVKSAKYLKRE